MAKSTPGPLMHVVEGKMVCHGAIQEHQSDFKLLERVQNAAQRYSERGSEAPQIDPKIILKLHDLFFC